MNQLFKNLIGKSLPRKLICENICQNLTYHKLNIIFGDFYFFWIYYCLRLKNIKNNNNYIIKKSPVKFKVDFLSSLIYRCKSLYDMMSIVFFGDFYFFWIYYCLRLKNIKNNNNYIIKKSPVKFKRR